jgi:glycosyltransferase involved in cell wall biosynthesis
MGNQEKKILFFHQGRMKDINGSIYRGLSKIFPQTEVRSVDINEILKARPWIIAINLAIACCVYGKDMIMRKRDLDESFFGTKYIFRKISKLAHHLHKKQPAVFSFQTWSMFDFSAPGTPHFVYTDHTYRSCKEYPAYGKNVWAPTRRDWTVMLEEDIYKHAKCIFTWSYNVKKTLTKDYTIPAEKVLCAGVGTNVPLEKLCQISTALVRYKKQRVIFIGSDWERKGGPELVEAFRRVVKVHKNARLTIVGCAPEIDKSFVEVIGSVNLDEVLGYLANSSIFCMPTKIEPFGIVFIEALASGLPVVALNLGAAPDFVINGQTGATVEYGDIDGLANALINLLDDPEKCLQYGQNGRKLVQEKYNWDKVFKKIGDKIFETIQHKELLNKLNQ